MIAYGKAKIQGMLRDSICEKQRFRSGCVIAYAKSKDSGHAALNLCFSHMLSCLFSHYVVYMQTFYYAFTGFIKDFDRTLHCMKLYSYL